MSLEVSYRYGMCGLCSDLVCDTSRAMRNAYLFCRKTYSTVSYLNLYELRTNSCTDPVKIEKLCHPRKQEPCGTRAGKTYHYPYLSLLWGLVHVPAVPTLVLHNSFLLSVSL